MLYRKEIDGLRAIAVVPVILFHAGVFGFSGGYVGVDVFFVISGFLITSIILEEKEKGTFSIKNFYERRARRILPALSAVLIATSLMAAIFMPAELLKAYSSSVASVVTFTSNFYFFNTSGYFSTIADQKPLLHTWSLAVEEQYYLFFPLMVSSLWVFGKKRLVVVIVSLSLVSLFLSQYLAELKYNDANFYLISSRAWELFFGSLVAFFHLKEWSVKPWIRELFGILGLGMIFYSIFFFNKQTPFPSFYTLIPVIGTCLIIVFVNCKTLVGQLLSKQVLVGVGLISYSLYLWHQPLFAFLRLKTVGEPEALMFIIAIVLTVILAYISWKYVEAPFRKKHIISSEKIFKYTYRSIAFFILVGVITHINDGFEQRFPHSIYSDTINSSPKRNKCHTKGNDYLKPMDACHYFGKNISWAGLGDSHSVELSYSLAKAIEPSGEGLIALSFSGCPPGLLFEAKRKGCSKWLKEALIHIEQNASIKNVVLAFRHSSHLHGQQPNIFSEAPDRDTAEIFSESFRANFNGDAKELYWKSFSEIISRLIEAGKTLYIVYPIPELPIHISNAITPFSVFGGDLMFDLEKMTTENYYKRRTEFINKKLDSLPYGKNLHAIKPFEILCDGEYCPAVKEGKALYFDDDHLSLAGSAFITDVIIQKAYK
ncbi:MAG: acyltransferase [Candidatus Thioglobus sp.]|nr:acyltransferase [Candidatus Thioglobus sp.]